MILRDATVRIELRFDPRHGGGSVITQRMSLFGPNADEYLESVKAGFRVVARRWDASGQGSDRCVCRISATLTRFLADYPPEVRVPDARRARVSRRDAPRMRGRRSTSPRG